METVRKEACVCVRERVIGMAVSAREIPLYQISDRFPECCASSQEQMSH